MNVTMPGYNDLELLTLPDRGFWAYVVAVVNLGRKQAKAGKLHPDTHTAMKRILRHLRLQEVLSGRPLIISDVFDACDAIIASWLPGTEAQGIADVLFGLEPFSGRLPHAWPRSMEDVSRPNGNGPLFPYLYSLTTLGPDLDRAHKAPGSRAGYPNHMAAGS